MSTQAPSRLIRPLRRLPGREDSLIRQVVAANVLLVALTIFAASLAAGLDITVRAQRWQFLILALAILLTLCVNLWMLQRRFRPLERLIERIEQIDPAAPGKLAFERGDPVTEIDRLSHSFGRLLDRIESERRRTGRLVIRAQEEERRRLARDLHDEVNQALAAILLRLEVLAHDLPPERAAEVTELKRLVNQAMEELLRLARHLRPTALDDHGLVPAIEAQLKRFAGRTGIETMLSTQGDPAELGDDAQTAVYRVVQEALANTGRHAGATSVEVALSVNGEGTELYVRDDGRGFDQRQVARELEAESGLGLTGMSERARLVGGELEVVSAPDQGTTVSLRIR
ncbi:MAG TPA: sensor histidine kinase [Thermoleophilaceae bacterium]|nr:sensor histidine kinase [Thermoleophilaceae bacterium]